ncbi:MAG: methylmalonyl Co-A mutase-associated GTPase MeaB [Alicyclobacillus sp.]|nr:methylmalonyl Co-A mutase-associated GTPase MeaB [Alicyclobacillus sp.]
MQSLLAGVLRGEPRAVARALTVVENNGAEKRALLQDLYAHAGDAQMVGFTGAPGAGKSSLVDRLISLLRTQGLRVGVIAVDPSSPFSGGALLGDRVRMTRHSADPGVYIRSVGSRGSLGGLGASTREMAVVLAASGCDVVLLETVGVGQAELDVMSVADTVALVLTPGSGDAIQAAKAGIMEIADVFVVNKCDLPGADALVRELQWMLHDRRSLRENWQPPIVRTVAAQADGLERLWDAVVRHREHLAQSGFARVRQQVRHKEAVLHLLEAAFRRYLEERSRQDPEWEKILSGSGADVLDPYAAFDELRGQLPWLSGTDRTVL